MQEEPCKIIDIYDKTIDVCGKTIVVVMYPSQTKTQYSMYNTLLPTTELCANYTLHIIQMCAEGFHFRQDH